MSDIRRFYLENCPVFITAVCYKRMPYLKRDREKENLLAVMREVKQQKAFQMLGYVILDDHFHWIIKPKFNNHFSSIMQSVKLKFVYQYKKNHNIVNNFTLWQSRFWDHVIRNEQDLQQHLDYIHYNPVKHGYTKDPSSYQWSSLQTYIKNKRYSAEWGKKELAKNILEMDFE